MSPAAMTLALALIIFLLLGVVIVLGVVVQSLQSIELVVLDFIEAPGFEFDDRPDMIEMLGDAGSPERLRQQGEAIVEGALASRQMTSHELEDALLGGKPPSPPVPGDVLEI